MLLNMWPLQFYGLIIWDIKAGPLYCHLIIEGRDFPPLYSTQTCSHIGVDLCRSHHSTNKLLMGYDTALWEGVQLCHGNKFHFLYFIALTDLHKLQQLTLNFKLGSVIVGRPVKILTELNWNVKRKNTILTANELTAKRNSRILHLPC